MLERRGSTKKKKEEKKRKGRTFASFWKEKGGERERYDSEHSSEKRHCILHARGAAAAEREPEEHQGEHGEKPKEDLTRAELVAEQKDGMRTEAAAPAGS